MKTIFFAGVLALLYTATFSQCNEPHADLVSGWRPSSHYHTLSRLSAEPMEPALPVDTLRFAAPDKAQLERLDQLSLYYLPGLTLETFGLPDPPANSSEQTKAEINYLLGLQASRTGEDIRRSQFLAGIYFNPRVQPGHDYYRPLRANLFHIGHQSGQWFNQDSLPQTTRIMAQVMTDAYYYMWKLKFHYLRPRPWAIDERIKNLENANWSPYPSGHSITAYTLAYVYAEVAPENSARYLEDAFEMAYSREILGVHYPSDSEVSRLFARRFVELLLDNEQFKADLLVMKEEWERLKSRNF